MLSLSWGHHLAAVAGVDDLAIQPVPTRTRFVAEAHYLSVRTQAASQVQKRLAVILDLTSDSDVPVIRGDSLSCDGRGRSTGHSSRRSHCGFSRYCLA